MSKWFDPERDLHVKQLIAFRTKASEILYGGAAGGGKALALDTLIPVPNGWSTMRELCPGDQVFDENGVPCNVVGVTEVMTGRPCYRVTFDDGSTIVADEQHQWLTMNNGERSQLGRRTSEYREKRRANRVSNGTGKKPWLSVLNSAREHEHLEPGKGSIRTTKEISETLLAGKRTNHSVKNCAPLHLPEAELPIDSYVLGLWLGDGTSCNGGFTTNDEETVGSILAAGYEVRKRSAKYQYGIIGFKALLIDAGLLDNKHIPMAYLRSSYNQRLALLQGLMDTDGTCLLSGSCEFYNCNKTLIDQVCELINSLGIKAVVREGRAILNGKDCGPKYRIKFTTAIPMFRVKRKLERQSDKVRATCGQRMIVSVEKVRSVPVKCIQVDSPSHLYLAGKAMVPTHNSFFMRYLAVWCAVYCPGIQIYLFRRTYPDLHKNHMEGPTSLPVVLAPLISLKLCSIDHGKGIIKFANGARIFLCHCQHEKNVTNYQGAEIHLLLIDELTHFTESIYRYLRGRCRLGSWKPPKQLRGAFPRILNGSNPGGIGHNWVKESFVNAAEPLKVWQTPKDEGGMLRQYIPAQLKDNPTMELNDPNYEERLYGLGDPALVQAMLDGNWDIVSGGALDDVWDAIRQIIPPFDIPPEWHVNRAFDWGSTAPFSVGWWAMSNGEDAQMKDGSWRYFPAGTIIRINEWYGWNGKANQGCKMLAVDVAKGIKERERSMRCRVHQGPADSAIFAKQNGNCIADDMASEGVLWNAADKGPGSRVNGLEKVRAMLKAAKQDRPEEAGMYSFSHCIHFTRTMPVLPRSEVNREDVDSASEDHTYDESRYRANSPVITTTMIEV